MQFTSFLPHSETVLQKVCLFVCYLVACLFVFLSTRHHFLADVTYSLINVVMFYEDCLLHVFIKLYIVTIPSKRSHIPKHMLNLLISLETLKAFFFMTSFPGTH